MSVNVAKYNGKSLKAMAHVFGQFEAYDTALRLLIANQRGKWKDIAGLAGLPYTQVRRYAIGQTEAISARDAQRLFRAAAQVLSATPAPPTRVERVRAVRRAARPAALVGGIVLE